MIQTIALQLLLPLLLEKGGQKKKEGEREISYLTLNSVWPLWTKQFLDLALNNE